MQSHLKHKLRQSLEQENLGPQELAEWKQREEDQQAEQQRSRRTGRKPLTRRSLAAMVDDGGAREAMHVQVQLRPDKLRRSNGSGAALDNAAAAAAPATTAAAAFSSPPPPQSATRSPTQGSGVRCPKCSQSFARKASFERHVAACKVGERNCTSDSSRSTSGSSSSGSDADDDEDDGDHEASPKRIKVAQSPRGTYGQSASRQTIELGKSVGLIGPRILI